MRIRSSMTSRGWCGPGLDPARTARRDEHVVPSPWRQAPTQQFDVIRRSPGRTERLLPYSWKMASGRASSDSVAPCFKGSSGFQSGVFQMMPRVHPHSTPASSISGRSSCTCTPHAPGRDPRLHLADGQARTAMGGAGACHASRSGASAVLGAALPRRHVLSEVLTPKWQGMWRSGKAVSALGRDPRHHRGAVVVRRAGVSVAKFMDAVAPAAARPGDRPDGNWWNQEPLRQAHRSPWASKIDPDHRTPLTSTTDAHPTSSTR